jgi:hypothetical protein
MTYSAIITCTTECVVQVSAESETDARRKIEQGAFDRVKLHDGGLGITERFHDIEIVPESFGRDD